jgi:hypothetical protein
MANEQDKNPTTGTESDISKTQATQQPTGQQGSQPDADQLSGQADAEQTGDQAATGQAQSGSSPDEGSQGDTATQQRTDVEGSSLSDTGGGQAGGNFVGSQGQQDSSSELVEDDDEDFAKDGQGAPEGK